MQLPTLGRQQIGIGMPVPLIDIPGNLSSEHLVRLLRAFAFPDRSGVNRRRVRRRRHGRERLRARADVVGRHGISSADCGIQIAERSITVRRRSELRVCLMGARMTKSEWRMANWF